MGFVVKLTCYDKTSDALNALLGEFPYFDASGNSVYVVKGQSSVSASGLVTMTIVTNDQQQTTRNVQLQSCTQSLGVSWAEGLFLAAAFLIVWALGFNGGLKR